MNVVALVISNPGISGQTATWVAMEIAQQEKRRHRRRKGFWRAIATVPGRAPMHCVIRDLSESGAFIEFPVTIRILNRFNLYLEEQDREYYCEVRHGNATSFGVFFLRHTNCDLQDGSVCFGRRTEAPRIEFTTFEPQL